MYTYYIDVKEFNKNKPLKVKEDMIIDNKQVISLQINLT
jgi:hypothetical protein